MQVGEWFMKSVANPLGINVVVLYSRGVGYRVLEGGAAGCFVSSAAVSVAKVQLRYTGRQHRVVKLVCLSDLPQ